MKTMLTILYIILLSSQVFAGQSVCFDAQNEIVSYNHRGNPIPGCLYYDASPSTQTEYDRVLNLFKSQPQRYIKILAGSPVEKSPAEKVASDDAMAAEIEANLRTAAKNQFNGNGETQLALRCFAKLMVDEINQVRTDPLTIKPARTLAQAKTAIQTCIDNKAADE